MRPLPEGLPLDTATCAFFRLAGTPSKPTPMMCNLTRGLALLALLSFTSPAHSQSWTQRPGTDHWYAITQNLQMQWEAAEAEAVALGGRLATIRSQAENDWIHNHFNSDLSITWLWIGLYQDSSDPGYSEPSGGWKWTSGEDLNFENWRPGEPSDAAGGMDAAELRDDGWAVRSMLQKNRAIMEVISGDCDGNGIPDVVEIATATGWDADSDGILDVCDLVWTMHPGTADEWAAISTVPMAWDEHRTTSEALGCSLAIIEDQAENDWIKTQFQNGISDSGFAWIGLYEIADEWHWVNGQTPSYTNWDWNQPNGPTDEDSAGINSTGNWHDVDPTFLSAIYECTSVDCDNNGVPDSYEIALNPSLDADLNGVLDSCRGGGSFTWEDDCNGNGVHDSWDISGGQSTDWNADGRPDECTPFTSILREHEGALENPAFTIAITDDLDGDSIDDYLIAEPAFDLPNAANTGRVCLRSGVDGSLIHEWVSNNNSSYTDLALGFSLDASGDWDGDGTNDILIGAPGFSGIRTGGTLTDNGKAFIYSGANPSQILEDFNGLQNGQRLGYAVCFLDDSTGDGRAEYATSSPFFTNIFGGLGQVTVYEGGTDNVLYNYSGNPGDLYGAKLASGADIDGDGYDDLLIGAPGDDTQGPGTLQDGRVEVVSGKTGSVIGEVLPVANWSSFTGASLAMLDDLNGDGRSEFVVGSPRYDLLNGLATRAGKVSVYQYSPGSNGNVELLFDMKGTETNDTLGVALTRTGDLNGDSISEFAVGVPGVRATMQPAGVADDVGKVIVIDPVTQRVIREIYGRGVGDRFGYVLASGEGDLDGDGSRDLIAGSRNSPGPDAAYAWICSDTMELLGNYYCEPNEEHDADNDEVLETGLRSLIAANGTTDLSTPGGSLTLTCDYMPTGQFGIFYYGTNTIQMTFGPVGGWRCVGGGVSRLPILNSGPEGRMELFIDYSNPPTGFNPGGLAGQTRHFQCWFRDAPGQSGHFNLSDAVTLTFQ